MKVGATTLAALATAATAETHAMSASMAQNIMAASMKTVSLNTDVAFAASYVNTMAPLKKDTVAASAAYMVEQIGSANAETVAARISDALNGLAEGLVFAYDERSSCESDMLEMIPKIEEQVRAVLANPRRTESQKAAVLASVSTLLEEELLPFSSICLPAHSQARKDGVSSLLVSMMALITRPEVVADMMQRAAVDRDNHPGLSLLASEAKASAEILDLAQQLGTALALTAYDEENMPAMIQSGDGFDLEDAKELLFHMLRGFMRDFPEIRSCLSETAQIIPQMRTGFRLIATRKFSNVKSGLISIARVLRSNVHILIGCNSAVEELVEIYKVLRTLEIPEVFLFNVGKHLVVNGRDILAEMFNALHGFQQEDYQLAGYNLGLALHHTLIGQVPLQDEQRLLQAARMAYASKADAADVAIGIVRGFIHDYPQLETCVESSEVLVLKLEDALEQVATRTFSGVKNGIKSMASLIQSDLMPALNKCKDAQKEVEKLKISLDKLRTAKSFFWTVGRHLLVEGVDIFAEITNAVAAYKAQEFEMCGYNVGQALKHLLFGGKDKKALQSAVSSVMLMNGMTESDVNFSLMMVDEKGQTEEDQIELLLEILEQFNLEMAEEIYEPSFEIATPQVRF